ncbi:MAG: rod shape-determining protein [Synergistaceae bacterium]|nr:rod shape-determining protein [Synergistaceae bacterium]
MAVHDDMPSRQRGALRLKAESSGFRDVEIMGQYEALCLGLGDDVRTLVCDFGASRCDFAVIEDGEILENSACDVCGDMFDKVFADYLRERRLMKKADEFIMSEAKRIKHILSAEESRLWHSMNIYREDFTRLIYFPVMRASRTADRLARVWKPGRFVLTGGCAEIPLVREIFAGSEVIEGLAVKGASLKALALTKQEARKNIADSVSRMRELRAELLSIEEGLNRQQKDRLYTLFRQAEGMNDAGIITLMESLIREIRNA